MSSLTMETVRYYLFELKHCRADAYYTTDVPYKYDLSRFCNVGSISFDHIDPSIVGCSGLLDSLNTSLTFMLPVLRVDRTQQ